MNDHFIEKLKVLHEKLQSHGISEDNYHLQGLFGSSNDEERISLNIKRGKYTIVFEVYYKERGVKHSVIEFTDIDEACEYLFKKALNTKTRDEAPKEIPSIILPVEEFRTSVFNQTKVKVRRRFFYNLGVFGLIALLWLWYFSPLPSIGLIWVIVLSVTLVSMKMYDDKYMGITAYGERGDSLVISEQYLEIKEERIFYSKLKDLVIYVDEYLGMPKEMFGIHHGGNNKIEFERNGKSISLNYIIKNKEEFKRVSRLVDGIERNPTLAENLKKL